MSRKFLLLDLERPAHEKHRLEDSWMDRCLAGMKLVRRMPCAIDPRRVVFDLLVLGGGAERAPPESNIGMARPIFLRAFLLPRCNAWGARQWILWFDTQGMKIE